MDTLKYCRVCLVTDVKMLNLDIRSSNSIGAVYSQLAQIPIFDRNQHVCFECASLLLKYQEFKSKCLRAHNILSQIKKYSIQITNQGIKNVDRKLNKLQSSLIVSPVVQFYDGPANVWICTDNMEIKVKEESENKEDKIEEISNIDFEKKNDFNESLDEPNNGDTIGSSLENFTEKNSIRKCEAKTNKEPQTKIKTKIISEDDFSDNEPLSKSITKNAENMKNVRKKNEFNIGYFDNYATVEILTPENAMKEVLLRKESSNFIQSPFKCDLCYRGFGIKATFDNHMKKHSNVYGDYECEICHLRFHQQIYLCKHRLACHKRKFSCKLCPYVCYGTNQAKAHVSQHKGKTYPCKDCGELFSMPNSLVMHKRIKHLKESVRESVCEHCGSTFGTPWGLSLHSMKVHAQDKNEKLGPECGDCGVHFSSEAAWKRHLVVSLKHKVSNGCKYCGDTFLNMDDLKSHMRVHSRKQVKICNTIKVPAACNICDKWLSNRDEYKVHVTTEHPHTDEAKKFTAYDQTSECEVCGQMFKNKKLLTYHKRKHTGERPHECAECGKTFRLPASLYIHRAVHTRRRAHNCQQCGRKFLAKSALNKHIKMHLGIRPHKCAICDKGFINMCDLKLHIKYVHDKVPWPKKKTKRNVAEDASFMDSTKIPTS